MLDFSCGIEGVPTIKLTKDEAEVHYPLLKDNIADDPEDNIEIPTTAPGPLNHYQTVCGESALEIIPTTLLAIDKQQFSSQSIGRLKALMLKENRTQNSH